MFTLALLVVFFFSACDCSFIHALDVHPMCKLHAARYAEFARTRLFR